MIPGTLVGTMLLTVRPAHADEDAALTPRTYISRFGTEGANARPTLLHRHVSYRKKHSARPEYALEEERVDFPDNSQLFRELSGMPVSAGLPRWLAWWLAWWLCIVVVGAMSPDALAAGGALRAAGDSPGDVLKDCAECPEMIVIPSGSFMMGSLANEAGRESNEGPRRRVSIGYRFALGRTEVTVGQWRWFVEETEYVTEAERSTMEWKGCATLEGSDGSAWDWRVDRNWRDPGHSHGDDHPVVCVSWNDARAYVRWLSSRTGKPYRLPSEAEWEYAARAGTSTSRPWGDNATRACRHANVADRSFRRQFADWPIHGCSDGFVFTSPVGHFSANGFGLRDMMGNVSEWVQDCFEERAYARRAPDDGRAHELPGCDSRGLRGGSWFSEAARVRAAYRDQGSPDTRWDDAGFRVARTLP